MTKSSEDAHELTTLCSLRTASSETLQSDAGHEDVLMKDTAFVHRLRQLSPHDRQRLAASTLAACGPRQHARAAFPAILELTRADEYSLEIRYQAMCFILQELKTGQAMDALARALVALPVEGIRQFFGSCTREERTQWETAYRITLRRHPQQPTPFWSALITAMAEAHATLDRSRALALLAPFNLPPLALLFPAKQDLDPTKFIIYACTTYTDRLPDAPAQDAHPPAQDRALEVFAAYFAALRDPAPLAALLARLVAGLAPRTPPRSRRRRARAPQLPHPASPHLLFALRLAAWSADARRGLVARGVVRAVEALYAADETAVVGAAA